MLVASVTAVLFSIAARLELLSPAQTLMSAEVFTQVALLRDGLFAFAVTLPSVAALGHLLLPRALPDSPTARLDNLAIIAHLGGAALLLAATATAGWVPLLLLAGAGALMCIAGTVQALAFLGRLRAPRPRGDEPELFARALLLTAVAELVALPVAAAALVVLVVERATGQALWHGAGADPLVFEHWLRVCMQPIAYVAVVPCLGLVSDIVGTRGRAPTVAMAAMLILGGVAWGARLFGDGTAPAIAIGSFFSLALLVPITVVVGHWLATLDGQGVPRWFAVGFMVCFAELAVTALPLALADVSQSLQVTTFAAAHHELLVAALAFAVAAALHRAWPGLTGASYGHTPALVGGALALLGLQLAIAPQLIAGSRGMPVTIDYPSQFRPLAMVASIGWFVACAGAAIVAANLLFSLRHRRERGRGLELV